MATATQKARASEAPGALGVGRVARVTGPVVDIEFPHDAIPEIVGECRTNQAHAVNGDAVQLTTRGILVWRKADNFTAFTDGRETWVLSENGIQRAAINDWWAALN